MSADVFTIDSYAFQGCNKLTTIYGYSGSTAETYASANSKTFIPLAKVDTKQLVLGTDISVRIYAYLSDAEDGAQMRVTMNGKTTVLDGVATGEKPYEYMFTYKGVAPQCLGDEITAVLIKDEDVLDDTYADFSVLSYCKEVMAMLEGSENYEKTCKLIVDLMEYGAAAQTYRSYKTASLVNTDSTISELAALKTAYVEPTSATRTLTASSSQTVKFKAASVFFDYDNKLMFKFVAPGVDGTFNIEVTAPGALTPTRYELSDCTLLDAETSLYVLYTDSISAVNVAKYEGDHAMYTIELKNGDTVIQSLTYGIPTYVLAMASGEDLAMANLAKALYTYGCSAYEYVNG